MFTNTWITAPAADAHRQSLIAQADHHRLVKLARAAQAGTRVTTPPPPALPVPIEQVPEEVPQNRRYAVSR